MFGPVRATVAGLCATLTGVGLARFAYAPLLPALVAAGWFTPGEAAFMGAANLAGYLAGALAAPLVATRLRAAGALRAGMVLATVAFFACAVPLSPPWLSPWFAVWRFLAGAAGGVLMVLAAPTVLPHIPAGRRGLAGGAIFTGVGLGIALSGVLVPPLLRLGVAQTWVALGLGAVLLTAIAWNGWPGDGAAPARQRRSLPRLVRILAAVYALDAVGLVPHMLFLADWVARGQGRGIAAGAAAWSAFGAGAVLGAVVMGRVGDRIGFRWALRAALLAQAVGISLALPPLGWAGVLATGAVTGAFVPGIPPLVLGRATELLPGDPAGQRAAWRLCTVAFAVGQATAAYAYSALFAATGAHKLLFLAGAVATLLGLALDLAVRPSARLQPGAS